MTQVFVSTKDCDCKPDLQRNILIITEGNTAVNGCIHTQAQILHIREIWEPK